MPEHNKHNNGATLRAYGIHHAVLTSLLAVVAASNQFVGAGPVPGFTQTNAGRDANEKPAAQPFKVHPKAFSLLESWGSDSEYPVVTEINLDAVAGDSNQFPLDDVKRDGKWIRCNTEE